MIAKLALVAALVSVAYAGEEPPPAKAHTYNVPVQSKVHYPGPTVTKHVETYSAPSIEKTTTITRTITAPLNAPAQRFVQYSAPAAPVVAAGAGAVSYAAPAVGYGAPAAVAYGAPAYGYQVAAAPAVSYGYAAPIAKAYSEPTLTLGSPSLSFGNSLGNYGLGLGLSTTYDAPALGYSLGSFAAAPVASYGAPVASYGAPAVEYGAPSKGGY